jgi:hypothetical protein
MEKFMFLFRGSDVYRPGQSPEALQALKLKLIDWIGDLDEQGIHVASEPLQPTGKQVSGTTNAIVDSPFGEAIEVIGGLTIVQAENIQAAVDIARSCPILASNATIEVRPIQQMSF